MTLPVVLLLYHYIIIPDGGMGRGVVRLPNPFTPNSVSLQVLSSLDYKTYVPRDSCLILAWKEQCLTEHLKGAKDIPHFEPRMKATSK